jgi:molybdopterin-guanine dinucleotide biosynthesis protein A
MIGVVLCGGKSTRMKQDKALLEYHGRPQWRVVHELLQSFCQQVVISVNPTQAQQWKIENEYTLVVDHPTFQNHGPMTGLLSVSKKYPDTAIFLLACDYPFLRKEHLKYLVDRRSSEYDIVCYQTDDQPEPLIAVFETEAMKKIKHFFQSGNDSIRRLILSMNANLVSCQDPQALKNVNTLEEYQQLQTKRQ